MYTRKSILFAAALMLLAACQAEIQEAISEEIKENEEMVVAPAITAAQEPQTKTILEVDGGGVGTIYWKPADEINVFYGTTSTHYVSQNDANATTAVFTTTDIIGIGEGAATNIWGLYPYNSSATCTGSAVTTTLPATQYGVPGTFDDDLFITLAHNNSTALTFYNVCGGIKFSLSRDDIIQITFRGNNNEDIAGDITLDIVNDLPHISVTSGNKEIILTPKTGPSFNSGEDYYIILLPTILSGGFEMSFVTRTGLQGTFNYTSKSIEIKRSVFSKKAEIDTYATFIPCPKQAFYTSTDGNTITPPRYAEVYNYDYLSSNTYANGIGIMSFSGSPNEFWGFTDQTTLVSIILPPEVGNIANDTFKGCTNLESVVLREGISYIADNAFYGCERLSSISFPASLYDIYSYAFYGCSSLITLDCSGLLGLYPFGIGTFANCPGLTTISLPSKAIEINERLFSGCTSLGSINIPSKVTRIRNRAFSGCSSLSSVSLPNSLTTIDYSAFEGCTSLTTVVIPAGITSIAYNVFYGCTRLSSITVRATTPPTCDYSFEGTSCPIYVPASCVDTYKSTSGWSRYADRIQAKP